MSIQPRWLSDREQAAWRRYLAMVRDLTWAQGRQVQVDHGISLQDFQVLVHVSEAKEGKIRTSALAEAAGWERSRLSHHLGRMERRGLVTRTACPRDGRGVIVGLTEEGWRTIHAAAPDHVALVRRVFIDALGEEGLRALDHVTTTVLAALEAEEPESR